MASKFTQVGSLQKSFGTEGFLKFKIFSDYKDDVYKSEFLWLAFDDYHVPFRIIDIQSDKKLIQFDDVFSIEEAAKIHNKELFLRSEEIELQREETIGAFIEGFQLYDQDEYIAEINEVRTIAGYLYAVIDYESKETLIPLNEHLILELNDEHKKLRMDLPEGILTL